MLGRLFPTRSPEPVPWMLLETGDAGWACLASALQAVEYRCLEQFVKHLLLKSSEMTPDTKMQEHVHVRSLIMSDTDRRAGINWIAELACCAVSGRLLRLLEELAGWGRDFFKGFFDRLFFGVFLM